MKYKLDNCMVCGQNSWHTKEGKERLCMRCGTLEKMGENLKWRSQ